MKTMDELKRDPLCGILADYEDMDPTEAWEAHRIDCRNDKHRIDQDDVQLGFTTSGHRVEVE